MRRNLVEQELLERAAALFAARGFRSTSLQDVASAMDISRPALYYYISSKEELLVRIVADVTTPIVAEVEETAAESVSAATRLSMIIDRLTERVSSHPERFKLLERAKDDLPESIGLKYQAGRARMAAILTAVVKDGVEEGSIRPIAPDVAASLILSSLLSLGSWLPNGHGSEPAEVAATLKVMFLEGMVEAGETSALDPVGRALANIKQQVASLERQLTDEKVV